jgi:1-acyl-sn-glycerol-3-phosphate acyltransferase
LEIGQIVGEGAMLDSLFKSLFVNKDVDESFEKNPKKLGSYNYDPWGYNPDTAKISYSMVKPLYENYFRVSAHGVENVPKDGRCLIIPNHSGQLPIDGMLVAYAIATRKENPRIARSMIERFFPTVPFVGNFLNQSGAVIGDPANCARMLDADEAIIVFPEGVRGSGKLYRERYQLQRFGNGFMHLAMRHRSPIVPVGVVGCEETIPSMANIAPVAKMLGIPYLPLTVPVIWPAKVVIHFGEPLHFDDEVRGEDAVTKRVETVKDAIRGLIAKGLKERKGVFS